MITLVIDDTLVMRKFLDAPGCAIRREHSRKTNRPNFVSAQSRVTLGVSVGDLYGGAGVLSVLSRLVPKAGNSNKLVMALETLQSLQPALGQHVRVLFDCWFMRARLVRPLLAQGCRVLGQARIDTALFLHPVTPEKPRRGRKRIYGDRLTAEKIDALPAAECELTIYGKKQRVRLRSTVALARFLKATPVHAAWCQFLDPDRGAWSKPRRLLASEIGLRAEEIVQLFARWGIEMYGTRTSRTYRTMAGSGTKHGGSNCCRTTELADSGQAIGACAGLEVLDRGEVLLNDWLCRPCSPEAMLMEKTVEAVQHLRVMR
jgi:hypothetical protein